MNHVRYTGAYALCAVAALSVACGEEYPQYYLEVGAFCAKRECSNDLDCRFGDSCWQNLEPDKDKAPDAAQCVKGDCVYSWICPAGDEGTDTSAENIAVEGGINPVTGSEIEAPFSACRQY